jgi:uncharacterized membrane protein YfcA
MSQLLQWLALPPTTQLAWLVAAAFAAGLARGFSGFGPALIFVPVAAMVIGPMRAVPLMTAIDLFAVAAMTRAAWNKADRGEVGLLALGALAGIPLGLMLLLRLDVLTLRWAISLLILALLGLVASGWRFQGRPTRPATVGVGVASGVLAGIANIAGPPVMVYLLSRGAQPQQIRAVFALYLAIANTLTAIAFLLAGLVGAWLFGLLLATAPTYLLGTWAGAQMFGLATETTFRRVTYAMVIFAAFVSLPLLDGVLRG